jgi:lipopolysaccharide/colanic/teichoic acid biosynthesis glycosyltransferase
MNRAIQLFIKRTADIIISVVVLVLLSPVLVTMAIIVRAKLGLPVLFRQQRPGLGGKGFILYKFRTMTNQRDTEGRLLPDEQRLPAFGSFLRSTSIDELPELFNVLKGDMSIIGPRPLMMKYLPRYTTEQARRHEVKPGITGWAQINGRNAISWEDRFKLDVWYVDNWSLWLDLKILAGTIWQVLKREGITQEGRATMDEFMGTAQPTNTTAGGEAPRC